MSSGVFTHAGYVQLFQVFGKWGDGIEVRRVNSYDYGFNVICGSSVPNTAYEWRFANGSRIGISNRDFRATNFFNGESFCKISILQWFIMSSYIELDPLSPLHVYK